MSAGADRQVAELLAAADPVLCMGCAAEPFDVGNGGTAQCAAALVECKEQTDKDGDVAWDAEPMLVVTPGEGRKPTRHWFGV